MYYLFAGAENFNQPWNVSVNNMESMFFIRKQFNQDIMTGMYLM